MQSRNALIGAGLSLAALVAAAAMFFGTPPPARTTGWLGGAPVTAGAISPRWPRVMPASLQLQGSVIDMGSAASGTMTIRIGSSVATTSVALPNYSVSLQPMQPDEMISIEIETPGYKYASILGSYRRLASRAGADAQLTVAELDRLRLSPTSTALHFFLKRELDGRMPVSDAEHEEMIRSVPGTDIAMAATVLDGFDKATMTLPQGYANGYGLLEDRAAYSNFIAPNGATRPVTLFDYFVSTPSIPLQSVNVGRTLLLSGTIFRGDATLVGPAVQIMVATPAGYEMHTGTSRRNASFTRQLVAGDLALTPQNEVYTEQFVTRFVDPGQPTPQVLERRSLVGSTLRRYFAGDRYSLWVEVKQEWVTYPELPNHLPEFSTTTAFWVASELDTSARYRSGQLVGDRALPVFCKQGSPVSLLSCEYALHKIFANGTGRTENAGPKIDAAMLPVGALEGGSFRWSSWTRSSFQIFYPETTATYWRIDGGDSATDLLVYVASAHDDSDTLTLAGSTAMIYADSTTGFDELTPAGTWRYATFEQQITAYAYSEFNFPFTDLFNRDPDGTGVQVERSLIPEFSSYDTDYRSGWQLLDGRLYDTRYRANVNTGIPNTVYFSSCAQAFAIGATQCGPTRVRYFRPLARVGSRLYGIEDLYLRPADTWTNYTPPFTFDRFSRPTYYQKQ